MTKSVRKGILYLIMTAVIIAALITIRPATSSLPPAKTSAAEHTAKTVVEPSREQILTFKLKLSEGILSFTSYSEDGEPVQQKIIDYIDIYSLYPEQLSALEEGITFSSRESAAEFIQDLGS